MSTQIEMSVSVPDGTTSSQLQEALKVAESAYQNALGNTVDAEFGYHEAVDEFEEMEEDEEELEDEMDDIDDEDFDKDEDEEYPSPSLTVRVGSLDHLPIIESLVGWPHDSIDGRDDGMHDINFAMTDEQYNDAIRSKMRSCELVIRTEYNSDEQEDFYYGPKDLTRITK